LNFCVKCVAIPRSKLLMEVGTGEVIEHANRDALGVKPLGRTGGGSGSGRVLEEVGP
jgi:hypothetical protein